MTRSFDEWWSIVPDDIKIQYPTINLQNKKLNLIRNSRNLNWKEFSPILIKLQDTHDEKIIPTSDELRYWKIIQTNDDFKPTDLRKINHSISDIILEGRDDIENLLK